MTIYSTKKKTASNYNTLYYLVENLVSTKPNRLLNNSNSQSRIHSKITKIKNLEEKSE